MSYRRYGVARDPYWTVARFESGCAGCANRIKKGERIFYYPNGRKAYGGPCAEKAAADFSACVADEAMYNGGY